MRKKVGVSLDKITSPVELHDLVPEESNLERYLYHHVEWVGPRFATESTDVTTYLPPNPD